ncbi:hypothetical protein Ciccas_003640 [Cichlidogyrus casuarinus]|uniref:Uncharacterized protein n=1 Tax=Cichlidogyrus casuarinus TaxID=1844966 RepID=A0ABD2QDU0_9PLAT
MMREIRLEDPSQKEEQLEQVKRLGPGKYEVAKAFEFLNAKPSSQIGPINNLAARFPVESSFITPPPNYYAAEGAPQAKKERLEARLKNASKRGICETRDQTERVIKAPDSGLPSSLYNIKPYTDQMIAKRISIRGPYDLTTGPRFISMEISSVPVGTYDLTSTIDRLKHRTNKWKGTFLRSSQYPKQSNIVS